MSFAYSPLLHNLNATKSRRSGHVILTVAADKLFTLFTTGYRYKWWYDEERERLGTFAVRC